MFVDKKKNKTLFVIYFDWTGLILSRLSSPALSVEKGVDQFSPADNKFTSE